MSTPTPPDAEPTPDREERELAALYRQLPGAGPDDALDARILDRARRAVVPKPRHYRRLWGAVGGLSTLAMAAGLTWHMMAIDHGPGGDAANAPAPAHKTAHTTRAASQVVPFRILAEPDAKTSRDSTIRKSYAPQAAERAAIPAASAPPKERTLVVPVRILPRAKTPAADGQAPSAGLTSGATTATASASRQAPTAQVLLDQARAALSNGDPARARALVRDYLRAYPDRTLPTDLAPYAPADAAKGSP